MVCSCSATRMWDLGDRSSLNPSSSVWIRILWLNIHSGLSSPLAAREQRVGMRAPKRGAPHPDPWDFRREEGGSRVPEACFECRNYQQLRTDCRRSSKDYWKLQAPVGKAKSSSEETFGFIKENGGGTVYRLDFPCRLSKVCSHLEGPVGNLGKLWHARGHESEF